MLGIDPTVSRHESVGAFSVIVKTDYETDGALHSTSNNTLLFIPVNAEMQEL